MFKKIKEFINKIKKSIENSKRDPITECELYKNQGCVFVDGPFCDFPDCSMNNDFINPNVIVYSHKDFDDFCNKLNLSDNNVEDNGKYAFISIIGTKQVIEDYLGEYGTEHYFKSNHSNVLNLDFDDVGRDFDFNYDVSNNGVSEKRLIHFKTISEEQAKECFDFIERNLGKIFIISCRAGKSRSQGVFRYIVDMYEQYRDCKGNLDNPCLTPNQEVVRKLKREYYKSNNIFIED